MKFISSPTHYALNVCAAAAMLAGCGGSTPLPNPTAQTPVGNATTSKRVASPSFATPERVGPNSSGAVEVLTGKAKLIKPCHTIRGKHGKSQGWSTNFSAHGNATGPYPGTFTATGSWSGYPSIIGGPDFFLFAEAFTITSGSATISGTSGAAGFPAPAPFSCTVFKDLAVSYTSGSVTGNAKIHIRSGHIHEYLQRF
jgi:hypothetical protein